MAAGGSGLGLKVLSAGVLCEEEKEMPLGVWLGDKLFILERGGGNVCGRRQRVGAKGAGRKYTM